MCQHHYPQNFWNPAFQSHVNGAQRVPGVVMIANHPMSHQVFLKAYVGATAELDLVGGGGVIARTENGVVEIMEPSVARNGLGIPVKADGEAITLNAMRFAVADLAATEALHLQSGVAVRRHGERLVVPPDEAVGATLIFEQN